MTSIDNYILNNKPYKIVNNNIFTVKILLFAEYQFSWIS